MHRNEREESNQPIRKGRKWGDAPPTSESGGPKMHRRMKTEG
jgi:hypothetical protein